MSPKYSPPFTMTDAITNLVIGTGELIGQVSVYDELTKNPKLRRENRIKTIHSSLAIEQNTLTLDQVTDVIDGKRVLGPPQDIREASNAYEAYEHLQTFDPYSIEDLLEAHRFMMSGLVDEAGRFRSKNAGVYDGTSLIHAGSPANYVPGLVNDLFNWMKESELHPLIKGCVFHYEFEFIHPFKDGNGRTGRLWHSLILQRWKPFFAWLPIETMIYEQQQEYYDAINKSNLVGESTVFIEFMLRIIKSTLEEIVTNHNNVGINGDTNVGISNVEKVISLLIQDGSQTQVEIANQLGISKRQVERIFKELKSSGKLERKGANKKGIWIIKNTTK